MPSSPAFSCSMVTLWWAAEAATQSGPSPCKVGLFLTHTLILSVVGFRLLWLLVAVTVVVVPYAFSKRPPLAAALKGLPGGVAKGDDGPGMRLVSLVRVPIGDRLADGAAVKWPPVVTVVRGGDVDVRFLVFVADITGNRLAFEWAGVDGGGMEALNVLLIFCDNDDSKL